ncbi:MAG: chemotaxis protein CheW [Candidatus Sericytochromatia bacterium]
MIVLLFSSNDIVFGISTENIQEITRMIKMDYFPSEKGIIDSVINYRGSTIPVVDSLRYLKKVKGTYDRDSIIIILNIHRELVGMLADDVRETLEVDTNSIERYQIAESDYFNSFFRVSNKIYPLLNMDRVSKDIKRDLIDHNIKIR